jgi:hypothetical protein
MRTDIHSISLEDGEAVLIDHQESSLLPEVALILMDTIPVPRLYVRMNVEQLDRLILEATACRREIDEKKGVPQ